MDPNTLLETLRPCLDFVLQNFGAHRIMFGSDWPVCNVGGPKGESGNWGYWMEVVQMWMRTSGLRDEDARAEWIWGKTAARAYGIGEF